MATWPPLPLPSTQFPRSLPLLPACEPGAISLSAFSRLWQASRICSLRFFPETRDSGKVRIIGRGFFHRVIGGISGGRRGKRDRMLLGQIEREPNIFVHQAKRKTWRIFIFQHERRFDV